jgi:ligand-binding SRPBCC domain-containing protein
MGWPFGVPAARLILPKTELCGHDANLNLKDMRGFMVSIEQCMQIAAPIQRCFDLSRSIEVHLLSTKQSGEQAVEGVTTGLIGPNELVRWRAKHLGVRQHLTIKITAFDSPNYFQDTMIEGAFKFMQHDHFFLAISETQTEMRDRFTFAAPIPVLGQIAEWLFLRGYMDRFLKHRNEILKLVAESDRWPNFLPKIDR